MRMFVLRCAVCAYVCVRYSYAARACAFDSVSRVVLRTRTRANARQAYATVRVDSCYGVGVVTAIAAMVVCVVRQIDERRRQYALRAAYTRMRYGARVCCCVTARNNVARAVPRKMPCVAVRFAFVQFCARLCVARASCRARMCVRARRACAVATVHRNLARQIAARFRVLLIVKCARALRVARARARVRMLCVVLLVVR